MFQDETELKSSDLDNFVMYAPLRKRKCVLAIGIEAVTRVYVHM